MRLSAIAIAFGIGPALIVPLLTGSAEAVQDQPMMIGGVETVCTGVGSAKDNPAWSSYPVKLVFANPAGEDLAQVHVAVMQGGKSVVETDCDAPWVLMKLPAGSYNVSASAGVSMGKASFVTKGGPQQTVTVMLPQSQSGQTP
ncbi:MAG TPA: hypothetical protein VN723_01940 [Rhizomicrobium sp.]|jgi:hypothetical protein|nr:hypothetical protein [Rhizomicrobium sp.]